MFSSSLSPSTSSRHSRARSRAVQQSRDLSTSRVRARTELIRDSPAASPWLGGREWGAADVRSTSVDIRTTSPVRAAGGFYPR